MFMCILSKLSISIMLEQRRKGRLVETLALSREEGASIGPHYCSARMPRVIHWGPFTALFIVGSVTITGTYTALQLWSLPQVK